MECSHVRNYLFGALLILSVGLAIDCSEAAPSPKIQGSNPASTPELPKVKPPVIVVFEIIPPKATIVEQVTLRWEVTGADTIDIDQGIGKVSANGTRKLVLSQNTVFRLTASNAGGVVFRTTAITIYENINASKIALTDDDVKSGGFIFRRNTEPKMDNTISTYSVTFTRKGNAFADEILDNVVSIYVTVTDTGNHYTETKANARGSLPNIIVIGDEGYIMKVAGIDQNYPTTYAIRFRKNNVFVNIGTLSDLKELEFFARIVEARIK